MQPVTKKKIATMIDVDPDITISIFLAILSSSRLLKADNNLVLLYS